MSFFKNPKKNRPQPADEQPTPTPAPAEPDETLDHTKVFRESEAAPKPQDEKAEEETADELTDISSVADSSSNADEKPAKMEEIYSTKDKRVRFKKQSPIEVEAELKRKQTTKEELIRGKMEFAPVEDDSPEVSLEAEPDPEAVVSDEIIEEIHASHLRGLYVQDIDGIDISLDPAKSVKAYEKKAGDTKRRDLRRGVLSDALAAEKSSVASVVTKVPVYKHEGAVDNIYLKAGRFTDVVESEYDEYLKSTDPTISKNYHTAYKNINPKDSLLFTLNKLASLRNSIKHQNEAKKAQEQAPATDAPTEQKEPGQKRKIKKPKEVRPDEKRLKKVEKEKAKLNSEPVDKTSPSPEEKESAPAPEKPKKPAVKKAAKAKPKKKPVEKKPKKPSKVGRFFKALFGAIAAQFFSRTVEQNPAAREYSSHEDERYVLSEVKANIKKFSLEILKFSLVGGALLTLVILERVQQTAIFGSMNGGALIYCLATLLLLLLLGVYARAYIARGLRALKRLSGNCDTMLALSYFGCLLQTIIAVILPSQFVGSSHHLYAFIPALGFLLSALGRLLMALRVKSNLTFISSRSPAYAAKIYSDEETARRMVSGTTASKGIVAYQHISRFLSDFLKISYAPDPSEETAGKTTPITIISAVFVAIAYAFIFKDVAGVASALSVMLCVATPFCALLAGNIPLLLFSKRMLKYNAMVAGYPSVKQFCDTSAFMVYADELFPKGCVTLEGVKAFQQLRVDDSLLNAAVVLKEARSPLYRVFDDLLEENAAHLPKVESVMYEEKSGVVGWINGERLLIGNMALMNRYHITVGKDADENRYRDQGFHTCYIAASGQLVALLILTYSASEIVEAHLHRAENNGIALTVSTTDPNITADLIADEYGLFHRSVKVLPTGYAGVMDEVTSRVEDTSRAYLATRGKFSSMCRAICGCVGLKSNITIGIVIETFALILGVLLCATMALYATVARLSIVEMLIYILFWTAATIVSTLIRRP